MDENSAKLALLKERLTSRELRKKEVIEAAQVVASAMIEHLKIPEVKLSEEMKDSLVQLALTLGALNKRFGEIEATSHDTVSAVSSAINELSAKIPENVTASLTDDQIGAFSQVVAEAMAKSIGEIKLSNEVKITQPKERQNLAAQEVKIKDFEKMVTKIVDKVPDKIDGSVKLDLSGRKPPATQWVNVRLTDGNKFVNPNLGGGGGLKLIGSNTDGSGSSPAPLKTLIDKTTTANVVYIGQAASGTATSSGAWTITKIDKTTSPVAITHTGATAVWDNRVNGSYS